jgi:outer membrane protein assembly factor BamB
VDVEWRRNLHFHPYPSSAVFGHLGVFLVERRTRLVSIDPSNGGTLWSLPVFNPWGSLTVNASVVSISRKTVCLHVLIVFRASGVGQPELDSGVGMFQ